MPFFHLTGHVSLSLPPAHFSGSLLFLCPVKRRAYQAMRCHRTHPSPAWLTGRATTGWLATSSVFAKNLKEESQRLWLFGPVYVNNYAVYMRNMGDRKKTWQNVHIGYIFLDDGARYSTL